MTKESYWACSAASGAAQAGAAAASATASPVKNLRIESLHLKPSRRTASAAAAGDGHQGIMTSTRFPAVYPRC
ncbi:hypothetical protein D3C72_2146900 [compost metagenome]